MDIRQLSRVELPKCVPFARKFHAEFKLPGTIHGSVWLIVLAEWMSCSRPRV